MPTLLDPERPVGDIADVLACFDETGAAVFTSLCHATAGDRRLAEHLLILTYRRLRDLTTESEVIADPIIIRHLAMSVFLEGAQPPLETPVHWFGLLTAEQRVVIELHIVEGEPFEDVATWTGINEGDAASLLRSAADTLDDAAPNVPIATIIHDTERWLDDTTRLKVRIALTRTGFVEDDHSARHHTSDGGGRERPPLPPEERASTALTVGIIVGLVAFLAAVFLWVNPTAPRRPTNVSQLGHTGLTNADLAATATTLDPPAQATPVEPGYVFDQLPPGFVPSAGFMNTPGTPIGWLDVFAEPDAGRTSGRWLAINVDGPAALETSAGLSRSSSRITIDDRPALVEHSSDGVTQISGYTPGAARSSAAGSGSATSGLGGEFTISGFGITTDDLITVATATRLIDGQPVFGASASQVLAGMRPIVSRATSSTGLLGLMYEAVTRSTYYTLKGHTGYIDISVAPPFDNDESLVALLQPRSSDPRAAASRGQTVTIGSGVGAPLAVVAANASGDTVLTWHANGETISLSGDIGFGALTRAAASIRPATTKEWTQLIRMGQSPADVPADGVSDVGPPTFTPIGSSITTDGSSWKLQMSSDLGLLRVDSSLNSDPNGAASQNEVPFVLDSDHPLTKYGSIDATIVVVALHERGAATALRITAAGRSPVTVPLVLVGPSSTLPAPNDAFVAGAALSEVTPYAAELVDDAGNVVRTLLTTMPS